MESHPLPNRRIAIAAISAIVVLATLFLADLLVVASPVSQREEKKAAVSDL